VTKKLAAVDALPIKSMVWKLIEVVPCYLDGNEILYTGILGNLGQLATVPKSIREEEYF
jgi:hypothetical protein